MLSWWSLISTGRAVPSSRIDRRVDHTETCTSLGPTCRVGGRPARGKDPLPIHEGASRHVSSYTSSDCKDTGASGGSRGRCERRAPVPRAVYRGVPVAFHGSVLSVL